MAQQALAERRMRAVKRWRKGGENGTMTKVMRRNALDWLSSGSKHNAEEEK